ncbi:EAL domain-containing protein, partial [Escherichia coli]|uniref:EAL domain-containing protein n=1 Tax=Escherichia coli TaxID=562 RepID=UPI001320F626
LKLSINVTATNICEPGFCGEVLATLVRHGLPASCIELELTETAVMTDRGQAMLQLKALDRAGVRLAIDDFGTGYSSLAYLQKLPVHVVKIDQSFVRWMSQDPRQASLVRAMIGLCHDLGYGVVAEGVEDQRAADLLREGGC